jgi:PAS domain S-box-containing protein
MGDWGDGRIAVRGGIVAVATVVYIAVFVAFDEAAGGGIAALATIPVLFAGFLFGLRAGVVAGLVAFPLNTALMNFTGMQLGPLAVLESGGAPGTVAIVFMGAGIGWTRDLYHSSQRLLAEVSEARESLRVSEARYALVTSGTNDGIWDWDLAGNTVFYSDRWAAMHGLDAAAVGDSPNEWFDRVHADDAAKLLAGLEAVRTDQSDVLDVEFRVRHAGGDWRWVLCRGHVVRAADGSASRIAGALTDITELERLSVANTALEAARDAALAHSRAKSAFLANMSHELRTPLNGVIGYTELLIEDIEEPHQLVDLDRIRTQGKHLLSLISDILDLSKIEAGRFQITMERVEVAPLLAGVVDTVRPLAGSGDNAFELDIDDDLGALHTDGSRLRQVLVNLLGNAFKFTEAGVVTLVATSDGDELVLCVRDTGVGISQDAISSLFDQFYQVDDSSTRVHGGAGLGLAISRRLVEMLGGRIEVISSAGVGSEFTVRLPRTGPMIDALQSPEDGDAAEQHVAD